jgi:hypothetical protein
VVDKLQQWDVIRQVRVWDGQQMTDRSTGSSRSGR